jgi:hypothetical protein
MNLKDIKIETNVPLPFGITTGLGAKLADMSVGDSFAIPRHSISNISTQVCIEGKRTGRKYATRTIKEPGQPELTRVWRLK